MSNLFLPKKIKNIEIKNRFVRAPTFEGLADQHGAVTDELITLYRTLAAGEIGLIITSFMFVHSLGQARPFQIGIHNDETIPGLKKIVKDVHHHEGRVAFELSYAGTQTFKNVIGQRPQGPSRRRRLLKFFNIADDMSEELIQEAIASFGQAARRSAEAGADMVHINAGGGYLINQFLSPFFNFRQDRWGGSDVNRFLFLKEILREVKNNVPDSMPILIKLNVNDYTPHAGITAALAQKYTEWLTEIGIDGLEVTTGTVNYSPMQCWRGSVPDIDSINSIPSWQKPIIRHHVKRLSGKHDFVEGWNLEDLLTLKPVLNGLPLLLVGGLRRVAYMEEVVGKGNADFIAMARPFLREPFLVKKIKKGETETAACLSCNRCIGRVINQQPTRCHFE